MNAGTEDMSDHDQDQCRSLDIEYQGRIHTGHWHLRRWKLWLSLIVSTIVITTAMGGAAVWGGNQIWHTKKEAKQDREKMSHKFDQIKESVDTLSQQINRLQSHIQSSNREFSQFIRETRRQRLEKDIAETEAEIDQYETRIGAEGENVSALYRQRLQNLRSKRDRLKRELQQFYNSIPDDRYRGGGL